MNQKEIELPDELIKVIGEIADDLYLTGWRSAYGNFFGTEMDSEQERQLKQKTLPLSQECVKAGVLIRLKKLNT